jgi:inner membrane protein
MANGAVHQLAGAVAGIGICLKNNGNRPEDQFDPLIAGVLGASLGKLPDWLEPAVHPNHRQFFHSVAVLTTGAYGIKKLFEWNPETQGKVWLRRILLVGGAAYISHLLLDGVTPKSLPLIGKV